MNKNQLQFTRKNFNKLHLKEIMNDESLDKLENKEDKILLEKCFQYVYESKEKLNQKKYKNKLFFILVGYDEVSMETKNTPFGMCSVSIDSTDDNYTKLVIFDLFKTVEGLDSDVFVKIFLKKIHDYYEKHFFVHSTSKKQYLIRELVVYIEPSKKTESISSAMNESNYTSVGKMVNLHKNSNKEFEEFTLALNVEQLIKQNKNKNISNNNKNNGNSNNSVNSNNNSNNSKSNNSSNSVENMSTNEMKNKPNNIQMNISENATPNSSAMSVNESIKSADSNKNLFKEQNMSIEQNTNQQSQQKSTTDSPSTLETIQETGVQMNERLTKTINSGLQSISQFFSGKKEDNSSANKNNGSAMVVSSNSAQMSVNSPQQDKPRNVLVGGAKKKAKKAKKVKKAVKKTVKKKAVKKTTTKKTATKKAQKKKVKKSSTSKTSKTTNKKAASKKKTLKKKPKHRGLFSILFR